MAPASRLAARLVDLSHAQLLEIAAAGCEASAEVKNRADAILAAHKPLAQWAVEGVLLSSDLVPRLLAPLTLKDCAAAAVCSQWANGWKATSEGRRHLTQVPFDFPPNLLGTPSFSMAVTPGGDELVVNSRSTVRILDRDMSSGASFEIPTGYDDIAAGEQFLYISGLRSDVRSLTYTGTEVACYDDPDRRISCPTLAPGGLLFCVLSDLDEDTLQDEIVALDAQTLQPRYQFGLSMLSSACGLVVIDEELFVCDRDNDRIQVFSLAGELRRSITGEWTRPAVVCFVKDRLYLIEEADDNEDEEGELTNPLCGRRIFALSMQGDTLQIFANLDREADPGPTFSGGILDNRRSLCFWDLYYFGGKLLTTVQLHDHMVYVGVMALDGS